jgi:hypothetical protein
MKRTPIAFMIPANFTLRWVSHALSDHPLDAAALGAELSLGEGPGRIYGCVAGITWSEMNFRGDTDEAGGELGLPRRVFAVLLECSKVIGFTKEPKVNPMAPYHQVRVLALSHHGRDRSHFAPLHVRGEGHRRPTLL